MKATRRQVITIVLIISLGLNLLIIGGIAARALSRPDFRPVPPNLSWAVRNLDEQTAQQLRPVLEEYGDVIRPLRGDMFRAQRQINQLITEDPMNKEAIADAFDRLRQAGLQYQEISHRQTISLFEMLTPEQRVQAMSFMHGRRNPNDLRRDRDGDEHIRPREPR
ncbi:MAG: periplasmic heavy metal sensor [Pseudohongiellaceae bacterium]|nr:periplasmic heavy metal sensor [Pseudohongiellaceae bacterium]